MNGIIRYIAFRDDRLLHTALGLGSALALWGLRTPGFSSSFLAATTILFVLAALFIFVRIILRMIFAWKREPDIPRVFEGSLTWRLFFYVTGVLVALAGYRLPFKAALALSRPSLERFAEASTSGQRIKAPCRVGLFSFKAVAYEENRVQFTFRKSEIPWGERGLYYSFSGNPVESSHYYSQESLGGGWYKWHYGGW
jgi:hypothetical protein